MEANSPCSVLYSLNLNLFKIYSKSNLCLYHNSFRLPSIKRTSACWPTTPTEPSGRSSTRQGTRPWCPPCVSLCPRPTKRPLTWLQGEASFEMLFWVQIAFTKHVTWFSPLGWIIYVSSFSCRTEQLYQNVLALWHHSHINMKSVVSWHYLMADIRAIRNWNVSSVRSNHHVSPC